MDYKTHEELLANVIGTLVIRHLRGETIPREIAGAMESKAVRTLEHIRHILNDDSVDDPDCFLRIEAIVCAMEDGGIPVQRHDF
ncbi:hypothetical protein [uncultured Oscillibacter sp.]|uniref:hypothetical protein n=1 Tax=uncultured Oscillibacter sp. TaxID=876091 RepID=UPI002610E699|nr:hypothetical protein [uncultured Oscillibacter sp.]